MLKKIAVGISTLFTSNKNTPRFEQKTPIVRKFSTFTFNKDSVYNLPMVSLKNGKKVAEQPVRSTMMNPFK